MVALDEEFPDEGDAFEDRPAHDLGSRLPLKRPVVVTKGDPAQTLDKPPIC